MIGAVLEAEHSRLQKEMKAQQLTQARHAR